MDSGKKDRPKQRDLIRWDNDKDIDVLLAIVKQCGIHKINIPWDLVGQEIGPKVTGNAVVQHLSKLRRKVEQVKRSGVKPPPQKSGYSSVVTPKTPTSGKTATKGKKAQNDDEEEVVDVDKASDPDESYGETVARRKRNPRRAKAAGKTYRDVASDDEAVPATPQDQVMADPVVSSAVKKRKVENSSSPVPDDTPTKPRGSRKSLKYEDMSEDEGVGRVKKGKGQHRVKAEDVNELGSNNDKMEGQTFGGVSMAASDTPASVPFDPYASTPVHQPAGSGSSPPSYQMGQGFQNQSGQFGSSFTSANPFNTMPSQNAYSTMMAPTQQGHGFLNMAGQHTQMGSGYGYGMSGQQMPVTSAFGQQMGNQMGNQMSSQMSNQLGNHGMQVSSGYGQAIGDQAMGGQDMGGQSMPDFAQLLQQRPAHLGWLNTPNSSAGGQGSAMPQNLYGAGEDNEDNEDDEDMSRDVIFNMLRGGPLNDNAE